ncbi:high mobility group protein [Anaeramoeba ignava]|uniref:High mobility group protein n=1 Tax=Anaeramoeba ignava TaxID=1746090 RepID=A0A9Q0RBC6_ANAIG|nr:high mobility group protein [Anaeramoeba ignava]
MEGDKKRKIEEAPAPIVEPQLEEDKRIKVAPPSPPKKPLNPYFLFSQDVREKIKLDNPELKGGEITKLIGQQWRDLDEAKKEEYKAKHKQLMEKYNEEIKEYQEKYPFPVQPSEESDISESSEQEDESDEDFQVKEEETDSEKEKDEYYEYLENDEDDEDDATDDSDSD